MILQVNKIKKNLDVIKEEKKLGEDFEELFVNKIKKESSLVYDSRKIGRRVGKTSLIGKLARMYDLPILTQNKTQKRVYDHDKVFSIDDGGISHLEGTNFSVILIDDVRRKEANLLLRMDFVVVGFEIYEQIEYPKSNKSKDVYEDYIDISSVEQNENFITAHASFGEVVLSRDKQFKSSNDGFYNQNNLNAEIDSVYLLDNTGKTIKKLM